MVIKRGNVSVNNNEKSYEARCKAYQDFFGDNWRDFEDMGCCQDATPEEAVQILMEAEEIDYCPVCDYYYFRQGSVYRCPSCGSLGDCSEPEDDYWHLVDNRWNEISGK